MNLIFAAAAVLYPLVQGAWEAGPLPSSFASAPIAPTHLEDFAVKTQQEFCLKAADPALRSATARALSLSSNPEAVKALERLAKFEKDPLVKQDMLSALLTLEEFGAPSDVQALRLSLKSESSRERALAAALLIAASKSPSEAVDLLSSEKSEFVHNFLWPRLVPFAGKASRSQVEKLFDSPFPFVRAGAVRLAVAAKWSDNNSSALARLALDPEPSVRFALASSLASGEGGLSILQRLAKDSNASVRSAVAALKPGDGRESLALALSSDPDSEVRRAACEALALFPSDSAVFALSAKLGDSSKFVRAAAVKSLGALKPSSPELRASVELQLESSGAREAAATALGLVDDKDAAPKILALLANAPSDSFAAASIEALGRLGFKPAAKKAASFAGSSSKELRQAVAFALGSFKDPETFDVLRKLAKDQSDPVAVEALKSAGLIGGASFEPLLYEILSDVKLSASRRAAASWAAARSELKDPRSIAQLKTLAIVACIPVPMSGEKMFDSDDSRISATLALSAQAAKGSEPASKAFKECLEAFKAPFAKMVAKGSGGALLNSLMEDYVKQLEALRAGEAPKAGEVPPVEPELPTRRLLQ